MEVEQAIKLVKAPAVQVAKSIQTSKGTQPIIEQAAKEVKPPKLIQPTKATQAMMAVYAVKAG